MNGRRWTGLLLMVAGLALIGYGAWRVVGTGGDAAPNSSPGESHAALSHAPTASATQVPATGTPLPTVTPAPTPGEAEVRAFVEVLVAARRGGDLDRLMADLHPATLGRYGSLACATRLVGSSPTFAIEVLEVLPQAAWDYVTDGLTATIPDAWSVIANQTEGGETKPETLHFAPSSGRVRWFTDCGEPLQGS